jgi:hypothetical protein
LTDDAAHGGRGESLRQDFRLIAAGAGYDLEVLKADRLQAAADRLGISLTGHGRTLLTAQTGRWLLNRGEVPEAAVKDVPKRSRKPRSTARRSRATRRSVGYAIWDPLGCN